MSRGWKLVDWKQWSTRTRKARIGIMTRLMRKIPAAAAEAYGAIHRAWRSLRARKDPPATGKEGGGVEG